MNDFAELTPEHQLIERFLLSREQHSGSKKSRKVYADTLKLFYRTYPGKRLDEITRADCSAFLDIPSRGRRNHGNPISPASRNTRLMVLNSLLKWSSEQDITLPDGTVVPYFDKSLPTRGMHYRKPARPYRSMDAREIEQFFAAVDQSTIRGKRDYAIMLCAFLTCRRREELARLKWGDISAAIFIDDGQERHGWSFRFIGKGHAREIHVQEFPGPCYRALIAYLEASGRLKDIKSSDYLFTNVKHSCGHVGANEKICGDWLNGIYHEIAKRAQLPVERLSIHSLRHAGAFAREQAGATVQEIQRTLDHASPEITFRYLQYLAPPSDTIMPRLEQQFAFLR